MKVTFECKIDLYNYTYNLMAKRISLMQMIYFQNFLCPVCKEEESFWSPALVSSDSLFSHNLKFDWVQKCSSFAHYILPDWTAVSFIGTAHNSQLVLENLLIFDGYI